MTLAPPASVREPATQAGPDSSPPLVWRRLVASDLSAIHALHRLSLQGVGPDVVKAETQEFFASLLDGRGEIVGVFREAALVAYGVLQHDLLPDDDPRAHLGLGREVPVRKLAGAAVHPSWRGQRLQRALVDERLRRAGPHALIFATSAPGNPASWRTLMACGLSICAIESRYGGHARYLMARWPESLAVGHGHDPEGMDLPFHDLNAQRGLLKAGWRGVAPGREGDGVPTVRYQRLGATSRGRQTVMTPGAGPTQVCATAAPPPDDEAPR